MDWLPSSGPRPRPDPPYIDELCSRIDEPGNQPRTGNAIDFRMLAGDPVSLARIESFAGRQFLLGPGGDTSFQVGGFDARCTKRCRHALADLAAVAAIRHHRTARRQFIQPAA